MTSTLARGVDRVPGTSERPSATRSALPALALLLLAGFVFRLTIAHIIFPGSGFESDIGTYKYWATLLAEVGPGQFYASADFADYPPGYLYILWICGLIAKFATEAGFGTDNDGTLLIKLPSMIADIGVAYLLYRMVRGWAGAHAEQGRSAVRLGLIAAALYLFNPVTWYDSAIWGQTDAVGALVMLGAVALLLRGHSEGATAIAVLAGVIKPQFGVVLVPVVIAVLLRRHLIARGSGPPHRPRLPRPIADWMEREQGWPRLITSGVVGLVVLLVLITPFGFSIPSFIEFLARTASGYQYLSVNAYNLWALIGGGGTPSLATDGQWSSDTVALVGPLSGVIIGTVLLAIGFLAGFIRLLWRADRWSIVLVTTFLCLSFFILPTRVHERYIFPVFAFLPILAVAARKWRWALLALAVGSFMNLHAILTIPLYATPNIEDLLLGPMFHTYPFVVLSALLQFGAFLFVAWQLRRAGLRVPDPLARALAVGTRWRPPVVTGAGTPALAMAAAEPEAVRDASATPGGSRTVDEGRSWELPSIGALTWFEDRLRVQRSRRDRSAELAGEPHGRLDRLDVFIVLLIIVSALVLRTYRLGEPYGMHFDEVYHARTATEFLQDWRYDEPHWIYEYTHPHVAKYAIALGLMAFGDDQVTSTAELGTAVKDVAIEPRWSPGTAPGDRNGDRLYVASGQSVLAYDLQTRALVATLPIPADTVAVEESGHTIFAAGSSGRVWTFATSALDSLRRDATQAIAAPTLLTTIVGAPNVEHLDTADRTVIVRLAAGRLISLDGATGQQTGETVVEGATVVSRAPEADRVVVDPALVVDEAAFADVLAEALSDDAERIGDLVHQADGPVTVATYLSNDMSTDVEAGIDDGTLVGASIETGTTIAIGRSGGVTFFDAATLEELEQVPLDGDVNALTLVLGIDQPTLYATLGEELQPIAVRDIGPSAGTPLTMPGEVRGVLWDRPTNLVHVLGDTPDGTGTTVYVVEPHANSVFADARLPFDPTAMVMDTQPDRPSDDRQDLLAFSDTGSLASVDVGSHAFAWRMPGVIAGAIMAGAIYFLARVLFRRRSVGLLAALLILVEGMAFANSRIAMNDTYVATFIVCAVALFAPLYLGIWRRRLAVVLVLPVIGVLLGLALGSKWVAAYAMGFILLAVLLRSALGRLVALAGMLGLTGVLGWLAIRTPPVTADGVASAVHQNFVFLAIMVVLTVLLSAAMVLRPIRMSLDELRFAVLAPAGLGGLLVLAGMVMGQPASGTEPGLLAANKLLMAGAGLLFVGALAYGGSWLAARFGIGPLAPLRPITSTAPSSPPPDGWLRPGWVGGIPWLYALGCLAVLPLAVYVITYLPWVHLGNRITDTWPPGNTGQTLFDLTKSMYDYHNNLRAGHAASSPWWAWPFDMKPVWFYQGGFANNTTGLIYDSGNLIIFWLGIPAVAFVAWQAWVRRSLPLTLVVLAIFGMWLPWVRIDRATFQYHVFTSLPFVIIALAYFLAELWHGASARTFLLARVTGGLAILGPPILWLLRPALCSIAGTNSIHPNGVACGPSPLSRSLDVTDATLAAFVITVITVIAIAAVIRFQRRSGFAESSTVLASVAGVLLVAGIAVVGTQFLFQGAVITTIDLRADDFYVLVLGLLAAPAYYAFRARDPRRWVVGVVGAAVAWFVLWYPNLSGLPLPNSISHAYLLLLPTWNYDFQFSVNVDPVVPGSMLTFEAITLGVLTGIFCLMAMVVARQWRIESTAAAGSSVEGAGEAASAG